MNPAPDPPSPRLPPWLRLKRSVSDDYGPVRSLLGELQLHTVCESARCPNHRECWGQGTATFMIAGNRCTRSCRFCAVDHAPPLPLDPHEPRRVAEAARRMRLRHVVVTSVTRDDLPDGGAEHFRQTIAAIHAVHPRPGVEVLVPDFNGSAAAIATVLSAQPAVFNHNLETVRRLTPSVRSLADYERSLAVLAQAKALASGRIFTKSGLMLGLGETEAEVAEAITDLRRHQCDGLTLGQYLQPSRRHLPVAEYVPPERFERLRQLALRLGFRRVASGPLVRSSYHAAESAPDLPRT